MQCPLGDVNIACLVIDARLLAQMGQALGLAPDKPISENQRGLKELQIARTALIKEQTRLRNRLKTQELAFTRRQKKLRLGQVARQLVALGAEIETRFLGISETTRAGNTALNSEHWPGRCRRDPD